MKNITKIFWGLALITIGSIFAINSLGIADIDIFFEGWWTLFIIVPSIIGLFDSKDRGGALIGLFVGVILLLAARGIITYRIISQLIVPFILIIIGFNIIYSSIFGSKIKSKVEANKESLDTITSVFSSEYRIIDKNFNGALVEAVFGQVILDLRNAKIDKEATLKVNTTFASADILVPNDVHIEVKSTKIFGGVDKQTFNEPKSKSKEAPTLYIDATAVFGGVKIKWHRHKELSKA